MELNQFVKKELMCQIRNEQDKSNVISSQGRLGGKDIGAPTQAI